MAGSYFGNVCSDDGGFGEKPKQVVEPRWEVGFDILGQVHASDGAELDTQGLQEDGDDVGEKHHDQQLVLIGRAGGHICRIVSCAAR